MNNLLCLLVLFASLGCGTARSDAGNGEDGDGPGKGIVYFSSNDGAFWQSMSTGLPDSLFLTDLATDGELLAASTKRHGVFLYDFDRRQWTETPSKLHRSDNVNSLVFYKGELFAGTEHEGVYSSSDKGRSWTSLSAGLRNMNIRRLVVIDHKLYAGTNGGLYVLDEKQNSWVWLYGQEPLQVNGIAELGDELFIGTNKGAFKSALTKNEWKEVMPARSFHNITADDRFIYGEAYSELYQSADKGRTWEKIQGGLPDLYTFNVQKIHQTTLAGQWDGVYKKVGSDRWTPSSNGLPYKFPATEMLIYKDWVIAASSAWVK